ncbi:MAG: hypothetical protein QOG87_748 [Actinomycetota bacterium]
MLRSGLRLAGDLTAQRVLVAMLAFLPIACFLSVRRLPESLLILGIGGALAVGGLVLVMRWPERSMIVLICVVPFQTVALALLYRFGAPGPLVRGLAAYRDLIVIGLAVVALRNFRRTNSRADALDRVAIAFLVLLAAYLLVPALFVRPDLWTPGLRKSFNVRLLAFRLDGGFVLLFLAARHAGFPSAFSRRLLNLMLIVGAIAAATIVFEFLWSTAWNTFAVNTVQLPRYEREVLQIFDRGLFDIRSSMSLGGREVVRPGGSFFDPLQAGFFPLVALAAGVELVVRRAREGAYLLLPLVSVAIILTFVRSAVLAAAVLIGMAMARAGRGRVRFSLVLAPGIIALLLVAVSSGFVTRVTGSDESNSFHVSGFQQGMKGLALDPMGRGLGSAAGIGDRFAVATKLTTESAYFQVGTEVGVIGMAMFIVMIVLLLRKLAWAARADPDNWMAGAALPLGVALAVGGVFLHIWLGLALGLSFWGAAGLALAGSEQRMRLQGRSGCERVHVDLHRAAGRLDPREGRRSGQAACP